MGESVRNRLIGSTVESLKRRGVAGTSISDLLERSGIARRSIYINSPGGKNDSLHTEVVIRPVHAFRPRTSSTSGRGY